MDVCVLRTSFVRYCRELIDNLGILLLQLWNDGLAWCVMNVSYRETQSGLTVNF